jgi:hypothetical protein
VGESYTVTLVPAELTQIPPNIPVLPGVLELP